MTRKLLSDNPNEVLRILFNRFGLKCDAIAQQTYNTHPLYPSFGSIAYVLSLYGIESCLLETNYDEISQLPAPFVIYYDGLFLPIEEVTDTDVLILNEEGVSERQPRTMLQILWTETALVFDSEHIIKRKSSWKKLIRYYFNKIMLWTVIAAIFIGLLMSYALKLPEMSLLNIVFHATGILGFIVGILFQVQEFDRSNKFVNSICHSKQQHGARDCSSILDSGDAKFMGLFSWADFGLLYFSFLTLLPLFVDNATGLSIMTLFSLTAVFYIPYSLLYQWLVARKWCTLCLMIQVVLFMNFVLAIWGLSKLGIIIFSHINLRTILEVLVAGILFTAFFTTGKIVLKRYLNNKSSAKYFSMLKHDYAVKNLILERGKKIATDGLEMIVINPEGKDSLTVIFNPICTPCIRKLTRLLEFWENKKETRMEIVFLLERNDPVAYKNAVKLLNRYYQDRGHFIAFLKDFVTHFPASSHRSETNESDENLAAIIRAHDVWCAKNEITSTPTMFLNGKEIPALYSVGDIDYMIN